jgi:hypothetical protein
MPFHLPRLPLVPALLAAGAWVAASSFSPVLAADDGQAPIWTGLGGLVGLGPDKEDTTIQYREHGKLVLPPKMDLPAPGAASPITDTAAWPVDPDVQRRIKARAAKKNSFFIPLSDKGHTGDKTYGQVSPTDTTITVRSSAGQGPATKSCSTGSPSANCRSPGWSLLSTLGLSGQPDATTLGPEPDRDWLTDPPKGYRAPTLSSSPSASAAK